MSRQNKLRRAQKKKQREKAAGHQLGRRSAAAMEWDLGQTDGPTPYEPEHSEQSEQWQTISSNIGVADLCKLKVDFIKGLGAANVFLTTLLAPFNYQMVEGSNFIAVLYERACFLVSDRPVAVGRAKVASHQTVNALAGAACLASMFKEVAFDVMVETRWGGNAWGPEIMQAMRKLVDKRRRTAALPDIHPSTIPSSGDMRGTDEKRAVLSEREAAGVGLWNEDDADFEDDEHVGRILHRIANGRNTSAATPAMRLPYTEHLPGSDRPTPRRPSQKRPQRFHGDDELFENTDPTGPSGG